MKPYLNTQKFKATGLRKTLKGKTIRSEKMQWYNRAKEKPLLGIEHKILLMTE